MPECSKKSLKARYLKKKIVKSYFFFEFWRIVIGSQQPIRSLKNSKKITLSNYYLKKFLKITLSPLGVVTPTLRVVFLEKIIYLKINQHKPEIIITFFMWSLRTFSNTQVISQLFKKNENCTVVVPSSVSQFVFEPSIFQSRLKKNNHFGFASLRVFPKSSIFFLQK